MMPKQYKVNASLTLLLAVLFYLFWQICKQQSALAHVATFTEDPYDAVGSFGTQLALFTALLSVVRAFRPYQSGMIGSRQVLYVRGAYLTCLSVAVTLGADVVAMLRYPSVWIGLPAGFILATLVGGMALLTALVGWHIHHIAHESIGSTAHNGWVRAIVISLLGAIICALYPQNWHESIPVGGLWTGFILFTAILGMVIFFASVWAWETTISPSRETPDEDFIDDLAVLYRWFKAHTGYLGVLLIPFEKVLGSSLLRPVVNWLNPRKDRWYGIALIGILIGLVFALGEGHLHPPTGILIVFASIECLGVLLGYAFFVLPLGLARPDFD
ncbi:MAG TPA: hypothetical protein VKU38_04475, partial [Ktedonobacteraceae bacterium]|nr:hypothetical protein [Ktedonobacteraceae bacterium]